MAYRMHQAAAIRSTINNLLDWIVSSFPKSFIDCYVKWLRGKTEADMNEVSKGEKTESFCCASV